MKTIRALLLVAIAIGALNMGACGGGSDGTVIEKTETDVANQPCNPLINGGEGNCPEIKKVIIEE